MSDLILATSSLVQPISAVPVVTRLATLEDVAFMDELQKKYNRQLGFFPRAQLEGYVNGKWVLIAEDAATGERLGFCASRDRYLKRDELGVVYLLCVVPGVQRKLVGATLIKSVFERSAYGCKLYCCWCAQDIAANYFWESLGFVPIAFRAGSANKGRKNPSTGLRAGRVHIFWQRRINEGDTTTPYWYPFQTNQGAIRQDRLVFPIPAGVHWKDVQAVAMPNAEGPVVSGQLQLASGQLPVAGGQTPVKKERVRRPSLATGKSKLATAPGKVAIFVGGKLRYVDRPAGAKPALPAATTTTQTLVKVKREKPPAAKFDPAFLTAARELRDRWLEEVNTGNARIEPAGKYELGRRIENMSMPRPALLEAA